LLVRITCQRLTICPNRSRSGTCIFVSRCTQVRAAEVVSAVAGAGGGTARFDPSFWGEEGIDRIQAETGGWPHLVQLVAETAVDMANDKGRGLDAMMLEAALHQGPSQ
jgi:hypothetical protein